MAPLHKRALAAAPLVILVVLAVLVLAISDLRSLFTREKLKDFVERAGWWAPLILVLVMAITVVISPIPNVPIAAVLGMVYGSVFGTAIAVTGGALGAATAFLIARHLGRRAIHTLTGKDIRFCEGCTPHGLSVIVLVARLIPVLSFDLVSYGAGLSDMKFRSFLMWTVIGMIPWTWFYTTVGSAVLDHPVLATVLGGLIAVLVLALPAIVRRFNPFGLRNIIMKSHVNDDRFSQE